LVLGFGFEDLKIDDMKILNFIDLAFQTFILGAVLLLSIGIAFTGHFESIGMVAMYGAIFLGPWQMVSSLSTCLARGHFLKWRLIHLVSSIAYIVILSVLASFGHDLRLNSMMVAIGGVLGFAIPAVLAVVYYFVTVKSFLLARATVKAA
jgi:hypothetical protein